MIEDEPPPSAPDSPGRLRPAVAATVRLLRRLGGFSGRVISRFMRNKGLLLAGGVAYNAMLSAVPLLALVLVALSLVYESNAVLGIIEIELQLIAGSQAEALTLAVTAFLDNRGTIGIVGFAVLMFFSSLAFRMLEDAMEIIFAHRPAHVQRSFWTSALRPYAFAGLIALAMLALTTLSVALERRAPDATVFGTPLDSTLLALAGLFGQILLFSGIYRVMPASHVDFRRALVGGFVAAMLWEGIRQIMTWYFANLSLVSVIYGSLTTVVIILLSFEVAAIIILLGAQVIAELEHSAAHDLPWYEAAP